MKVVNIALNGLYTDGFTYHENLLPKYHKKNGYEVHIIASEYIYNQNGQEEKYKGPKEYIDENGIYIHRLPVKKDRKISYRFKRFEGVYELLEKIQPDIIFCHLFQFIDIKEIVRYKKEHKYIKLYLDNHSDFFNSAHNWISKYILHGLIWRYYAQKALPFIEKFYGVLPARVEFARKVYGITNDKLELLVMGADDELVKKASAPEVRANVRKKNNIQVTDFLIMTGGKINQYRPETLNLMKAVKQMETTNIKLLIFGSVDESLKEEFDALCEVSNISYVGWLKSDETYDYIAAADLMVFPGLHSVMWEQSVAQGIPCIFRKIAGVTHVDLGGNAMFLSDTSVEELMKCIKKIKDNPEYYNQMKLVAQEKGLKTFSYMSIAKKSISE